MIVRLCVLVLSTNHHDFGIEWRRGGHNDQSLGSGMRASCRKASHRYRADRPACDAGACAGDVAHRSFSQCHACAGAGRSRSWSARAKAGSPIASDQRSRSNGTPTMPGRARWRRSSPTASISLMSVPIRRSTPMSVRAARKSAWSRARSTAAPRSSCRTTAGSTKPSDFRGKRIGTPQFGNTQDVAARAWLIAGGLRITQTGGDAQVVPTANPDQLTLFLRKTLDAVWTVEPWVSRLEREADGKVLIEEKDAITTILVARARFLSDHRELVRRLRRRASRADGLDQAEPGRSPEPGARPSCARRSGSTSRPI